MKFKILLQALSCCLSTVLSAHTLDYGPVVLRHWTVPGAGKTLDGTFLVYKNHEVYIEKRNHRVSHFPLAAFSPADQAFALNAPSYLRRLSGDAPLVLAVITKEIHFLLLSVIPGPPQLC